MRKTVFYEVYHRSLIGSEETFCRAFDSLAEAEEFLKKQKIDFLISKFVIYKKTIKEIKEVLVK